MQTNDSDTARISGSVSVGDRIRIFQRGQRWYANYQDGGRQYRVSLKTINKKEAVRRALRIETKLASGQWRTSRQETTIQDAIEAYRRFLIAEGRANKTMAKYTNVFCRIESLASRRHVTRVSDIGLTFMDAYRQDRVAAGMKPKTVYTESVVVRQLVNFSLQRNLLDVDPLKGFKLRKPKPTEQPCWTHQQVENILGASPPEFQSAFTILADTGMRIDELCWLTWVDVDLSANVLHVRPKDGWKPKSGDKRAIPMSQRVRQLIGSLVKSNRWLVTNPASQTYPKADRQLTERRSLAALKRVLGGLGLKGHLHTFRHAFISNALLNNIPVAVVRDWVGHVDEAIIKLYTHVHNSASQDAMARLSAPIGNTIQIPPTDDGGSELAQNQHNQEGN